MNPFIKTKIAGSYRLVVRYEKLQKNIPSLVKLFRLLLAFPSLYRVESGFSHVAIVIKWTEKHLEDKMWFVAQTHKHAT